jgi:hypothetical protein
MKVFDALKTHPTRITGFLMVAIGALQANSNVLQTLLTDKQFAWFTVVAGAVVAGLGFLNARGPTEAPEQLARDHQGLDGDAE